MALVNYDIDFKDMVGQLCGYIHRKTVRVAWLTGALKPLRTLHDIFLTFSTAKGYEVKWNGQTIVLERLLRDRFGDGIFITNHVVEVNGAFVGEGDDTAFFVGERNDQSQYIDISYNIDQVNFTVNVPAAISFVQSELEAWINKYKLFGTTYEIVIV